MANLHVGSHANEGKGRGEFTIDEGAMTECSPPLRSPWVLVGFGLRAVALEIRLRKMISFSRFAEGREVFFFPRPRLATAVRKS